MTDFDDHLWTHLVAHHDANRVTAHRLSADRRTRPLLLGGSAGVVAAIATAAALLFSGTAGTQPAYAMTPNGDGTYTISLNDIATGIPALNAKLQQLGINETVVPIETNCSASTDIPVEAGSGSMSETVTVGNQYIASGQNGFLAAEQMPNGQVLLAIGTTAGPVPSCFPAPSSTSTAGQ